MDVAMALPCGFSKNTRPAAQRCIGASHQKPSSPVWVWWSEIYTDVMVGCISRKSYAAAAEKLTYRIGKHSQITAVHDA